VARIPGSLNSKAAPGFRQVKYCALVSDTGLTPTYTLAELATWFAVEEVKYRGAFRAPATTRVPIRNAPNHSVSQQKRNAAEARWRYALQDFVALRHLRCGFQKGDRTKAILTLCILLRKNGLPEALIEESALELARECKPELPSGKVRSTLRDSARYKHANIRNQTFATWLNVRDDERPNLPHWCPTARLHRRMSPAARRQIILTEIESLGLVPSLSVMMRHLADRDLRVSRSQLALDYQRLGIASRRQGGRPRNLATSGGTSREPQGVSLSLHKHPDLDSFTNVRRSGASAVDRALDGVFLQGVESQSGEGSYPLVERGGDVNEP
jgi:hypothetical protein